MNAKLKLDMRVFPKVTAVLTLCAVTIGCHRGKRTFEFPDGPVLSVTLPPGFRVSTFDVNDPEFYYLFLYIPRRSSGESPFEVGAALGVEIQAVGQSTMSKWMSRVDDPNLLEVEIAERSWMRIGPDVGRAVFLDGEGFRVIIIGEMDDVKALAASIVLREP